MRGWDLACPVQDLPRMHEILNLNPNTTEKRWTKNLGMLCQHHGFRSQTGLDLSPDLEAIQ